MSGILSLILVALGASFAMVWLLNYVPLVSKKLLSKRYWSPRLFLVSNVLGPLDAGVTLILIGGSWIGFTSALGISAMIYNVLTGIGLSMGVLFAKKVMAPKWKNKYEEEVKELENQAIL